MNSGECLWNLLPTLVDQPRRDAKAAALSTLLGIGSELGADSNDNGIIRALRCGAVDSLNQTGQQVVRRNLNIQPTLTVRPGFPLVVIVNRISYWRHIDD